MKVSSRPATSVCRLRHDQMEQGPTEPRIGRSTFLLSSSGAGGGGGGAGITEWPLVRGSIPTEHPFPCRPGLCRSGPTEGAHAVIGCFGLWKC